jgi:metal-sulfur cluster biosynthetic enzyme
VEEFKIIVETTHCCTSNDRFAIEDAVKEALEKIGIEVVNIKVVW